MLLDENGLGDHGTEAARAKKPADRNDDMKEKHDEMAHHSIVARKANAGNYGAIYQFAIDTTENNLLVTGGQLLAVNEDSSLSFHNIEVRNGANLLIGGGSTIDADGTVTVTGNSKIILKGKNAAGQVGGQWVGKEMTLVASNMQLDNGSSITADGQGYTGGAVVNRATARAAAAAPPVMTARAAATAAWDKAQRVAAPDRRTGPGQHRRILARVPVVPKTRSQATGGRYPADRSRDAYH